MQNKGFIRVVAICFILACFWQLSFSLVSSIYAGKADKAADKVVERVKESAAFAQVPDVDKAFYLDSIRKIESRRYTDSISSKVIYFGNTYKQVQNKEINLGLDLKGGMNVMLQVQLEDLVKALAGDNRTPEFEKAVALAKQRSVNSQSDFITLFGEAWKEVGGGQRLSSIFGTIDMAGRINPETSDEQVLTVLKEESESAVSNSFNVLRNRIDRFGVTQPSIQKLGNTGRILVELPGVKEPERVRKLLQGTASLEFWTTYYASEIAPYLEEANAVLAQSLAEDAPAAEVKAEETTASDDIVSQELKAQGTSTDEASVEAYKKANPLFAVLSPSGFRDNACIGFAAAADTALINKYLARPEVAAVFPAEFRAMWTVKSSDFIQDSNIYDLVAIKASSRDGKAPLDGGYVTDARVEYNDRQGGEPSVSMTMNAEGANIWARLTKENVGRQIAIVLDGTVYSYPNVLNEISGGVSSITGHFSIEEATDLTNVLKSGKLPAPATIVQEQVVGPSLGAASIRAGLISFIIAFLLVLIYMIFFYKGAGLAADAALLTNVILLFGVLSAFGAVLTLPGIAGLVLTLGMAVDANVIIYERVKEELKAGKGLGKAIHDGYGNAYSAIIDGQVTTLLTGIVLFFFGSGPIKGFATTLIIGIITSVLTSIFITRIIFDDRVSRGKNITFETDLTKNFLKNTKIDFISGRKWSYLVSGALILISLGSIFIKGFTYGVDFTGGRTYVVRFDKPVTAEDVREATGKVFDLASSEQGLSGTSVEVKQFGGDSQMKITTSYKYQDEAATVDNEIEGMLYESLKGFYDDGLTFDEFVSTLDNPNGIISSDKVGASIANDIKRNAVISIILALIVIFAYIAFRFKGWAWGLGGVVSLAHTSIIIIGFFSLFSGILPFNLDVDQTFIAAILTIIGYAINDNVVIFDRIRENLSLHVKDDFKDTVNKSLNATLTRTVNTSVSTLLPMLAIAIFGGESIRGLSVALCLGICIGTYASIMIGTPIMFDATMSRRKKLAAKEATNKK
ncbi:MAG: protein translocase subunit SecDF [Bacteroides sp.]|nr:protein translocase subunit SecDF [Bacteroides sp.]MDD7490208.1 protein translocase subunit SecDF [Bacteroides sp.]MDY5891536.1 protein translocase subunit SecDF [Candidatus Cryptobacteroides sp.]